MSDTKPNQVAPDSTELRKFGLLFGVLIIGFFGLLIPWIWGLEIVLTKWPWLLGGVFILWALILPASLGPVYRGWVKFGNVIGWFNTRVILGLVFYVVIMPMGLVMCIVFHKDPMKRAYDSSTDTYRVVNDKPEKKQMERPY